MRRELETWPRENCEPTEQSKELDWKPSPYSARASSRPYRGDGQAGGVSGAGSLTRLHVAQSAAGAGSSAVLSRQLKAGGKGPSLLPVDLCNKAGQRNFRATFKDLGSCISPTTA